MRALHDKLKSLKRDNLKMAPREKKLAAKNMAAGRDVSESPDKDGL